MVRRGDVRARPMDYASSGDWPHCELEPDAPVWAHYALHISVTLEARLAAVNVSELHRATGVARSTVRRIVDGETWADLVTIARLESALDLQLWPIHRHDGPAR